MSATTRLSLTVLLVTTLTAGCGLFGDLPEFKGGELGSDAGGETTCSQASDCPSLAGAVAACPAGVCEYTCEPGQVDLDASMTTNGCEYACAPTNGGVEQCDGLDNDCNDVVDDAFAGGQISAGGQHTCATTPSGDIYCWGNNEHGQLGLEFGESHNQPTLLPISDELDASLISAGEAHTCMVDAAGENIYCWGSNSRGQLGDGTQQSRHNAEAVALDHSLAAVSAGREHTCVLDSEDRAFCWGDNTAGQLGAPEADEFAPSPTPVGGGRTFQTIDAGGSHTCAANPSTYCWGANEQGQLGDGTTTDSDVPGRVDLSKAVASVSAGASVTCARSSTPPDEVHCWGAGGAAPELLTDPDGSQQIELRQVSVGGEMICGLTNDKTIVCGNIDGQWQEFSSRRFVAVTAGAAHACAIGDNGRIYCWGQNASGQVGNRSTGGTVVQPKAVECGD